MSNRTLLVLLGVTAVVVAAGLFVYMGRATEQLETREIELLFADLTEKVNDVAAVSVVASDTTFRVERDGDAWSLVSKGGYPADFDRVREVVVGISQLRVVEPKTSRPENYAKIGVVDPSDEGAASTKITLEDATGAAIASVILGERDFKGRQSRQYVRKTDDAQAWLVSGELNVDGKPMSWVEQEILRLERNRVQNVSITHPDGECVYAYKNGKDEPNYAVADLPEDRELRFDGAANAVGTALSAVRMEDVAAAGDIVFDPDETTVTEWRTFDGLKIVAESTTIDGKVWARFSAAYEPVPPAEGEDPVDEDDAKVIADEAAELQARFGAWAFALAEYQAANLRKRTEEMLKEVEAPEPEPTPPAVPAAQPASPGLPDLPAGVPVAEPPVDPPADPPAGTEDDGG